MTPNVGDAAPVGIVLVHGYRGSPLDFEPLIDGLAHQYAVDAVDCLRLPGHGEGLHPPFNEAAFLAALASAIDRQQAAGRRLVLIGHSTGGSLLLAAIAQRLAADSASLDDLLLLVLCATPPRIDLGYAQRWNSHTADQTIPLDDVGALVGLVNRLARRAPLAVPSPVLIVHGEADELVPVADAGLWRNNRLLTVQRQIRIKGARHHLFAGAGAAQAIDTIRRAIDDARQRADSGLTRALFARVPELESFCTGWPDTRSHVENSPAGLRAVGHSLAPTAVALSEPTLANIEITTRCTLGCVACARTQRKLQSRFMSREDFCRVLESLPHAYRIVLVGLGEPLLHPEVIDFIGIAVAEGRRVSLVTSAMNLDAKMAHSLCDSGLSAITFSLDAVEQATAQRVRLGSDMRQISTNIRTLIDERNRQGSTMATAAFSALCVDNIGEFEAIVDFVADHGIDALMVTDLNFPSNQPRSLHGSLTPEHARLLRQALKRALARQLPVLSVLGLEEFALDSRYLDYVLLRGEQLARRSLRHANCLSPWQTIPVSVEGNLSLCDCQPDAVLGNIHRMPLSDWWNGTVMREQRQRMLGDDPPAACRVCPRF
jgi:MoaA/NifB/PqqE/SkfB family radical SAM enzyme/alpha-beta hydrolase superfamily lysophospholipase